MTRIKSHIRISALALLGALTLNAVTSASAAAQTVFIDNAKIVTNTAQGTLETGDVIITNGRIRAIGAQLTPPDDAQRIDGAGQWVTPPLFAPYSNMGIVEVSLEGPTNDIRADESKTSVSERAADSFNPFTTTIGNTRIEGIGYMVVSPNAGHNIFGGVGFIANTTGALNSIEKESAFIFVRMGEGGANLAGGSRAAALAQLRGALADGRAYPGRYDNPHDGDALPRQDAAIFAQAVRGNLPLMIEADRASDMMRVLKLKADYPSLDIIFVGAAESWVIPDALKAAGAKVLIDPHENLPETFERVGARLDTAARLAEAGVEFGIMTRSQSLGHNIRVLPQHAGNAVGNGLDWDTAFKAITSTPAAWFNMDNRTRLQNGDRANLVIWDGDPLDVRVSPNLIMIEGVEQSLTSRQTKLRDRYLPNTGVTQPHKYR